MRCLFLFISLIALLALVSAHGGVDDHNTYDEGVEAAESSQLRVEAKYSFEGFGSNAVEIRAEAKIGDGNNEKKTEIRFKTSLGSDGPKVEAEYRTEAGEAEARYRFKMFVKRIVEYIPDATDGYQKGVDQLVNVYGSTSSGSGHAWTWNNLVDVTPEATKDRKFSASTQDGVFTILGRANPTPGTVATDLTLNLNDIKFDYSIDMNKLKTLGFLNQSGTELAIIGVLQSRLTQRFCDDDNATGSACINDVDGALAGFAKWAKELNCKVGERASGNLTVSHTAVSSDDSEGDSGLSSEGSHATVFAWSLAQPLNATGVCVWDPVFFVGAAPSMASLSLFAIAAAIFAKLF